MIGTGTFKHTYPSPNNNGKPWVAGIYGWARLDNLRKWGGGRYTVETTIDLLAGRMSTFD
jgi:hypothetical protein